MNKQTLSHFDYTHKDYDSLREVMLELAKEKLPEWTDHSPNDFGVMLVELFAHMGDMLFYYQDRIANESYLETAVERQSIVNLLRLIGYELRPPTPASAELTLLFEAEEEGEVEITKGASFQTTGDNSIQFQYVREQPLKIDLDSIEPRDEPDNSPNKEKGKQYKLVKNVPVIQVDDFVAEEPVGSSDGTAGQRFPLDDSPLIADQLEVKVNDGSGDVIWQRQQSLLKSKPDDRHYTIRYDKNLIACIEFGDGRTGLIPPKGIDNIMASYRIGGGIKGNVPVYAISEDVSGIDGLAKLFNEKPATGGAEAESLQQAKSRGPQLFKSQQRAVTAEDFEAHAKDFGISKVRARAAGWNIVELYIAPDGGSYPSDTLKEDLHFYLQDKCMITSILQIKDPVYVPVTMSGTIDINAYYSVEQVKQQVREAISGLLAFEQVDFGQPFYLSKIYEAVEAIDGIDSVNVKQLQNKNLKVDILIPQDGKLDFAWNEIPQQARITFKQEPKSHSWIWQTDV